MLDLLNNPGTRLLGRAYAGSWADTNPHFSVTRVNENAGVVDFGCAVAKGSTAAYCKRITADGDKIAGFAIRQPTVAVYNQTTGEVSYEQYTEVAVGTVGRMLVTAVETVAEGDGVISITAGGGTLGSTTGGAAGAGAVGRAEAAVGAGPAGAGPGRPVAAG